MCCYYNPTDRGEDPTHDPTAREKFRDQDRAAMVKLIQTLSKPVIHYKVMAAGRNDPDEAFAFCARAMRPQDLVCVGVYTGDKPGMIEEDVGLFEKHWAERSG